MPATDGLLVGDAAQASGFYCPGWDGDSVNDPPGCKPIPIDSGGFRTTVEKQVIGLTIELDASVDDFDEAKQVCTKCARGFYNNVSSADNEGACGPCCEKCEWWRWKWECRSPRPSRCWSTQ